MNNTSIINNSRYIIYTKLFKIDLSGESGNDVSRFKNRIGKPFLEQ